MGTLLITLFIMLLFCVLMSVGVFFGRKPIAGSCGGMGAALGEKNYVCDLCGGDESKCEEKQQATRKSEEALAYEVTLKKEK